MVVGEIGPVKRGRRERGRERKGREGGRVNDKQNYFTNQEFMTLVCGVHTLIQLQQKKYFQQISLGPPSPLHLMVCLQQFNTATRAVIDVTVRECKVYFAFVDIITKNSSEQAKRNETKNDVALLHTYQSKSVRFE